MSQDELNDLIERFELYKDKYYSLSTKRDSNGESIIDKVKALDPQGWRNWKVTQDYAVSLAKISILYSKRKQAIAYRASVNEFAKKSAATGDIYWKKFKNIIDKEDEDQALAFYDFKRDEFDSRMKSDPDGLYEKIFVKQEERLIAVNNTIQDKSGASKTALERYNKDFNLDELLRNTGGFFIDLAQKYENARKYILTLPSEAPIEIQELVDSEDSTLAIKNELMNMIDANRYANYLECLILNAYGDQYMEMKRDYPGLKKAVPELKLELQKYMDSMKRLDDIWKANEARGAKLENDKRDWEIKTAEIMAKAAAFDKIKEFEVSRGKEGIKDGEVNNKHSEIITIGNRQKWGIESETKLRDLLTKDMKKQDMEKELGVTNLTLNSWIEKIKKIDKGRKNAKQG